MDEFEDNVEFEIVQEDEEIERIITIEGVIHAWDSVDMEYKPVDNRRFNWGRGDFLN